MISVFFPGSMANVQVSYTCISLAEPISRQIPVRIFAKALVRGYKNPLITPSINPSLTKTGYRYVKGLLGLQGRLERLYRDETAPGDLAWMWPGRVVPAAREMKNRGIPIVAEVINTHQASARMVLDGAYGRAGLPAAHGLTDSRIADENEFYRLADRIFSPSPNVTASLLENGVDADKIIETSYGWNPAIMPEYTERTVADAEGLNVITVGTVCVRKGQHNLVRAWNAASVPGRLEIVGWIGDDFKNGRQSLLSGPNVELAGPVKPAEIGKRLDRAEVFAFATVEEGDPQVTYEAASRGLAIVTTPAGAGRIVRDGIDGIILDPYDTEAWVETFRKLRANPDLRLRLGRSARERSLEFSWDRVAARRAESFRDILGVN